MHEKYKKIPYRMIGLHPILYRELLALRDRHAKECGFALSWSDFIRRIISLSEKK